MVLSWTEPFSTPPCKKEDRSSFRSVSDRSSEAGTKAWSSSQEERKPFWRAHQSTPMESVAPEASSHQTPPSNSRWKWLTSYHRSDAPTFFWSIPAQETQSLDTKVPPLRDQSRKRLTALSRSSRASREAPISPNSHLNTANVDPPSKVEILELSVQDRCNSSLRKQLLPHRLGNSAELSTAIQEFTWSSELNDIFWRDKVTRL
jgi:hypothetical protein